MRISDWSSDVCSSDLSRQIAVAMSVMWKKIGVSASLKASDFRGIAGDTRAARFDVIRYQWFAPYDDPSTFLALVRGRSSNNMTGHANGRHASEAASADLPEDHDVRMAQL